MVSTISADRQDTGFLLNDSLKAFACVSAQSLLSSCGAFLGTVPLHHCIMTYRDILCMTYREILLRDKQVRVMHTRVCNGIGLRKLAPCL